MALKKGSIGTTDTGPAPHLTRSPLDTGTRPSTLRFEHRRHMYFDGRKWLPSVTGIAGKIEDKGGLIDWSAGCVAECAINEAAELSRLRRLNGDEAALEWLKNAANRKRDEAAVSGSDLHDVADRMLSGMEMPEHLDPNIKLMAEHVLAFMAEYRVEALHSEVRLCNRSLGYAGTTDQIGFVPQYGELPLIIDWKTSRSMYERPKFSHGKNAIQLTAYSHAEVMFWDDKTEADMIEVNQDIGLIVMVRPEGYKVYDYDLRRAWPQFERALDSYHWWRNADELARGPIRPAGLVDHLRHAAEMATSLDELRALRERAVHYEVWSDELRAWFDECRAQLESPVVVRAEVAVTCQLCNHDRHLCPGCGEPTPHKQNEVHSPCGECLARADGAPEWEIQAAKARETELTIPPTQVTNLQLATKLRMASSEGELTALWEAHQAIWTEDHTRLVRARLTELTREVTG